LYARVKILNPKNANVTVSIEALTTAFSTILVSFVLWKKNRF
jgi:hypothetical protein